MCLCEKQYDRGCVYKTSICLCVRGCEWISAECVFVCGLILTKPVDVCLTLIQSRRLIGVSAPRICVCVSMCVCCMCAYPYVCICVMASLQVNSAS